MRFRPQITGILTLKFALADTKCELSKTTGQTIGNDEVGSSILPRGTSYTS